MIDVLQVGKHYPSAAGRRWVFRNIDWHIEPGQRWALLGRNGRGKSSLLRILAGAETPSEGRIVRRGTISWPLAFGGGFQGGLSGADNIRFVARLYGVDERHAVERAAEFAGLGRDLFEPYMTYSSGMRARLAFSASLLVDFDCILIDEIVSVGDAHFRDRCNQIIGQMRENKTMVLISHDMNTVRQYCDHVAVIDNGTISLHDDVEVGIAHYMELAQ